MIEDIASKIYNARSELVRLETERQALAARKAALNSHIAKMKQSEFQTDPLLGNQCNNAYKRQKLIDIMVGVDKELLKNKELRQQWRRLAGTLEQALLENVRQFGSVQHGTRSDAAIVISIRNMRDRYLEFSADPTRINSMRLMASQFADELTDILVN